MEKEIGKIPKNSNTDVVIRIDDFGGRKGLTIREFVTGDRYVGFTKSGVRIPAEEFSKFKEIINSIDEKDLKYSEESETEKLPEEQETLQESFEKEKEEIEIERPGEKTEEPEETEKKTEEEAEEPEEEEELPDY